MFMCVFNSFDALDTDFGIDITIRQTCIGTIGNDVSTLMCLLVLASTCHVGRYVVVTIVDVVRMCRR